MNSEINRLKDVYEKRDTQAAQQSWETSIYHPRHPLGHLFQAHHFAILIQALNKQRIDLAGLRILDVGCGYGNWLRYFLELGAETGSLTGVDISDYRLQQAHRANPAMQWALMDGKSLPFATKSFDMVLQTVVFSSVLDEGVRRELTKEMSRVTKANGRIFWLDHKRPLGALAGFTQAQVLAYFPDFTLEYAQSAHPRYFRRFYKLPPWLVNAIYYFTKGRCDSWLLMLKKK